MLYAMCAVLSSPRSLTSFRSIQNSILVWQCLFSLSLLSSYPLLFPWQPPEFLRLLFPTFHAKTSVSVRWYLPTTSNPTRPKQSTEMQWNSPAFASYCFVRTMVLASGSVSAYPPTDDLFFRFSITGQPTRFFLLSFYCFMFLLVGSLSF